MKEAKENCEYTINKTVLYLKYQPINSLLKIINILEFNAFQTGTINCCF